MSLTSVSGEGLRKAEERVQRVAERLARLPVQGDPSTPQDVVDLSAEMAALLESRNAHAANAKTFETAAALERHVLDILG